MDDLKLSKDAGNQCSRSIPLWLVLLDNIPTFGMYVLGTWILAYISGLWAVIYAAYSLSGIIWFWGRICPYCHHYGTKACPCGYGVLSAKLFKPKQGKSFRRVFRRNIIYLFPGWFIPPVVAGFLLWKEFSASLLVIAIIFSVVAFILIPVISKKVGCKDCEIREECPWMTKK
jgi:hypothetical protein